MINRHLGRIAAQIDRINATVGVLTIIEATAGFYNGAYSGSHTTTKLILGLAFLMIGMLQHDDAKSRRNQRTR